MSLNKQPEAALSDEILNWFETKIKWVGNEKRKKLTDNNTSPLSIGFGNRWWYGKYGLSKASELYPELYALLLKFIDIHDPNFKFTNIIINKNFKCKEHRDKYNSEYSYIIGLGNYTEGELVVNEIPYDIKDKWLKFDGNDLHYVKPFNGNRYTIVYFTNNHKY